MTLSTFMFTVNELAKGLINLPNSEVMEISSQRPVSELTIATFRQFLLLPKGAKVRSRSFRIFFNTQTDERWKALETFLTTNLTNPLVYYVNTSPTTSDIYAIGLFASDDNTYIAGIKTASVTI